MSFLSQESEAKAPQEHGTPGIREVPANERFLQQALGTTGDVRLPAMLLSSAALLAVLAVAVKKLRDRRTRLRDAEDGGSR